MLNCKERGEEVECLSKEEQAEGNVRVKRSLFLNCRKDIR